MTNEADRLARARTLRHDLLTPLNQILGYSQLLQDQIAEMTQEELRADLSRIEIAGKRLVGLIDALFKSPDGPNVAEKAPPPRDVERATRPPAGEGVTRPGEPPEGRILVVDDNEMNRDMLSRRLSSSGFFVEVAEGGAAALSMWARAAYDLVLLDVMMPDIGGLDVLRQMRAQQSMSDLPVIMATARDASEDIVEALRMGANDYVTKPLDFAVVLARIGTQIALKRVREKAQLLNEQLLEAQEQISRLVDSSADAIRDVPAWSQAIASDLAQAIGAREIAVFTLEDEAFTRLTRSLVEPPDYALLQRARSSRDFLWRGKDAVAAVSGMTGELHGALVVSGKDGAFTPEERRLVASFGLQLGGALELLKTKRELGEAQERNRLRRQEMEARGLEVVQVCPKCGACFGSRPAECPNDGEPLQTPRLLPHVVLGRYRLARLLGEGGMGTVFHAVDQKLSRDVAIKILKPEHFDVPAHRVRFEYEAHAVAQIDHPGVVVLFDTGELEDGSLFIVMEKLEGHDLGQLMARYGPGAPRQVASFLRQTGEALAAAHRAGLVHRDVKPENVFLIPSEEGFRVKILDFGLAKPMFGDTRLTQSGLIVGTPAYMAPEQIEGKDVDHRTDLYSLAAVAYEALTGRRVTLESDLARTFIEVLQETPPAISELLPGAPRQIDVAFAAALAKDRLKRPGDVKGWVVSFVDLVEEMDPIFAGWEISLDSPPGLHVGDQSTLVAQAGVPGPVGRSQEAAS